MQVFVESFVLYVGMLLLFGKFGRPLTKYPDAPHIAVSLNLNFMYQYLGSIFAVGLFNYLVRMNFVFDSHSFKQQNFILINTFLKSNGTRSKCR